MVGEVDRGRDDLSEFIADLIASGWPDVEIVDILGNSATLIKLGYVPKETDLIAVIRKLMMERTNPTGGNS